LVANFSIEQDLAAAEFLIDGGGVQPSAAAAR
jgi:hypothetical protein